MNQGNTNVDVGQPGFTLPDTTFSVQNTPTSIKQVLSVNFERVFPNPFNDFLKITYESKSNTKEVRFSVYNIYGQKVRELYTGMVPNGVSTLTWDGRSDSGQSVAKGAYLLTIEDNQFTQSHLVVKQ